MLSLDSQGPPDAEIWYNLYLAAVAIDALCVRDGKAGLGTKLGKESSKTSSVIRLMVMLKVTMGAFRFPFKKIGRTAPTFPFLRFVIGFSTELIYLV